MKKKRVILVLLLALVISGAVSCAGARREPVYKEKPLRNWVENFGSSNSQLSREAEQAIAHFGANAVPHLIRMLEERESADGLDRRVGRDRQAAHALAKLGANAEAAVPALIQRLTYEDRQVPRAIIASGPNPYLTALRQIGPEVAEPLGKALLTGSQYEQQTICSALEELGRNGAGAVPCLIEFGKRGKREQVMSLKTLGLIKSPSHLVVPALITGLESEEPEVRDAALDALGHIGFEAVAAVPRLKWMAEHEKPYLKMRAEMTLDWVDPARRKPIE